MWHFYDSAMSGNHDFWIGKQEEEEEEEFYYGKDVCKLDHTGGTVSCSSYSYCSAPSDSMASVGDGSDDKLPSAKECEQLCKQFSEVRSLTGYHLPHLAFFILKSHQHFAERWSSGVIHIMIDIKVVRHLCFIVYKW